jgi:DNA recombination protein RmuC
VSGWVLAAAAGGAAVLLLILLIIVLLGRRGRIESGDADRLLDQINRRLGALEDIRGGLDELSKIFLVPYTRGGFAEDLLENLLKNWLPKGAYQMQYRFKSGERVDAVVRLGAYMVAIDSKFPLEAVKRSIEAGEAPRGEEASGGRLTLTGEAKRSYLKHIKDVASKYIRPEEGTLSFALLYIPSERVYYHGFVESGSDLLEEALNLRVLPVSPSSLFLYLQTVSYGLKGFAFQKKAAELAGLVYQLKTDYQSLARSLGVAGTHLKNLDRAFDDARDKLDGLETSIDKLDVR